MEKLTKSLCILTALALLAACDKDADSGVQIPAAKTNFEVSLPGALETYGDVYKRQAYTFVPAAEVTAAS